MKKIKSSAMMVIALVLAFTLVSTASLAGQEITTFQVKDNSLLNADISPSAAIATSKLSEGADFLQRDSAVTWTVDQSAGGFKLTNLGAPSAATDAANKSYVDNATSTQAAGNGLVLSGGSTIDFVTGDGSLLVNPDNATVNRASDGAIGLGSGLKVNTDNTSIEISSNNLRLASGAAGNGLGYSAGVLSIGNTDGTLLINPDNATVNSTLVLLKADYVFAELVNESPDNSTTAFTVDNTINGNKAHVSINGLQQRPTTHYSISGATVTFTDAPKSGDVILVDYMK